MRGHPRLRHPILPEVPQPRRRHPRHAHPGATGRPAHRADRQLGHPAGDETRRAAREDLDQARPEPLPTVTPGGLLRIDKARCKTEANLDGKYLLRCSDPHLPAADIALGYQQLLEVERGWRDMKQILDLRPVYHRLEQRIRAHVVLCWLALLLIRIIETTTGQTWHHVRRDLDRLHAVTFTGPTGTFRQRTDPTKPQTDLYARLDLPLPKKIIEITPAQP
jgi:hypothetical protein